VSIKYQIKRGIDIYNKKSKQVQHNVLHFQKRLFTSSHVVLYHR